MGMDVYVPWPISTLCMINVTRPSRSMRMKAFGANPNASFPVDADEGVRCEPVRGGPCDDDSTYGAGKAEAQQQPAACGGTDSQKRSTGKVARYAHALAPPCLIAARIRT